MNTPLPDPIIDTILSHLGAEKDFVFLETSKTTPSERRSLLFTKPIAQLTYRAGQEIEAFFRTAQGHLDQGYFLAGWFAYEFGYALEPVLRSFLDPQAKRPLARLGVYPAPFTIDHAAPWPEGRPPLPFAGAADRPADQYRIDNLLPNLTPADYLRDLARIKEYIAAGDTYQVNYTLKLMFEFTGSPEALYKALRRNQPVSFSAYLDLGGDRILSLSPELFFRKSGKLCEVRPMKGTMPRGHDEQEDQRFAAALQNDLKNRSENVMIVDLLRNDLGRVSRPGSVTVTKLFTVETYPTLHQMTSSITGRIADHIGLTDLFKALFPCGSVTGAPKIRTMEIIHELEHQARGVYTGAIGYLAPDGDAVFNVPIRTVVLNEGRGEMGIGSGIVHDSDPEAEWRECLLKGKFLSDPRPDFQLIETILWQRDTGFWLLEHHLTRLAASAGYFDYPADLGAIRRQLQTASAAWEAAAVRVRLLLHQDGRIEIKAEPCDPPAALDLPAPIECAPSVGRPRIIISSQATDSSWPFLYHKTTRRELYSRERQQAVDQGYYEVVFINENGEITEGSITNILIRRGQEFFTPPLGCGLLAGVCRAHLLSLHPGLITERPLRREDLAAADAIYLVNSVRGIVQVRL